MNGLTTYLATAVGVTISAFSGRVRVVFPLLFAVIFLAVGVMGDQDAKKFTTIRKTVSISCKVYIAVCQWLTWRLVLGPVKKLACCLSCQYSCQRFQQQERRCIIYCSTSSSKDRSSWPSTGDSLKTNATIWQGHVRCEVE